MRIGRMGHVGYQTPWVGRVGAWVMVRGEGLVLRVRNQISYMNWRDKVPLLLFIELPSLEKQLGCNMYFNIPTILVYIPFLSCHPYFISQSYIQNYMLSVCPSIRYGRSAEMTWPQDVRNRISSHWVLEATTRWSLRTVVMALATGTKQATGTHTSFLDRLYKNQATMHLHVVACS